MLGATADGQVKKQLNAYLAPLYADLPTVVKTRSPIALEKKRREVAKRLLDEHGIELPIPLSYRPIMLIAPMRTLAEYSCVDGNLGPLVAIYHEPTHIQHHLAKNLVKAIRELGIEKDSYIVFLSWLLGPIALDPTYEKPMLADEHIPLNFPHYIRGTSMKQARQLFEDELFRYLWLKEHKPSAVQTVKEPTFDEKSQKEALKKIRMALQSQFTQFLIETAQGNELKIFPYLTSGIYTKNDQRIISRAIRAANEINKKISGIAQDQVSEAGKKLKQEKLKQDATTEYVHPGDIRSLNSEDSLRKLKKHLSVQILNQKLERASRRESKEEVQRFSFPAFEEHKSRTITPFSFYDPTDDTQRPYIFLYDPSKTMPLDQFFERMLFDEERVRSLADGYGIPFEEVPFSKPIEVVGLELVAMYGREIRPFVTEADPSRQPWEFDVEAADMNAYCIIDVLLGRYRLKKEKREMRMGRLLHEIIGGDPKTWNYINYEIYELPIWGIPRFRRSQFTELTHFAEIDGLTVKFTPDAAFIHSGLDLVITVNHKNSTPGWFRYDLGYAMQLAVEALGFQAKGYKASQVAFLNYILGPPFPRAAQRGMTHWPALREIRLTKEVLDATKMQMRSIASEVKRLTSKPSKISEEFSQHIKNGCRFCTNAQDYEHNVEALKKLERSIKAIRT